MKKISTALLVLFAVSACTTQPPTSIKLPADRAERLHSLIIPYPSGRQPFLGINTSCTLGLLYAYKIADPNFVLTKELNDDFKNREERVRTASAQFVEMLKEKDVDLSRDLTLASADGLRAIGYQVATFEKFSRKRDGRIDLSEFPDGVDAVLDLQVSHVTYLDDLECRYFSPKVVVWAVMFDRKTAQTIFKETYWFSDEAPSAFKLIPTSLKFDDEQEILSHQDQAVDGLKAAVNAITNELLLSLKRPQ